MKIRFWGVRGSYPVSGSHTNKYGGNTSCIEVRLDNGELIILDAGSGIRALGKELMDNGYSKGKGFAHLLITHTHWDHIQGFPHFKPAYVKGNRFQIWSRKQDEISLRNVFAFQNQPQYYPTPLDDMSASLDFKEVIVGQTYQIAGATVKTVRLNHPNLAVGYRIEYEGKCFAYITDTAPFEDILIGSEFIVAPPTSLDDATKHELKSFQNQLLSVIENANVMVYDTFFRIEEYRRNPHWGHSTPEHGLGLCQESGVEHLLFFHHAPSMSDEQLDQMRQYYATKYRSEKVTLDISREGQELTI
jgi:phosphoribosyl 1,2-cyclic phosphodiesterase